jgi:[ribosomal protein S5]-alanine N-acetyltransferase
VAVERHVAPARLTSARLRGEATAPAHADALCALLGDPRVGAWLGGVASAAEVHARIVRDRAAWARDGFGLWTFFDRATGEAVGRGGLMPADVDGDSAVEVAWAVRPQRWGEGLGTEIGAASLGVAFETLRLPEVVAFTLPDNRASRRVMEKLGMAFDGMTSHAGLPHVLYRVTRKTLAD